jgi:O-antigen ligase
VFSCWPLTALAGIGAWGFVQLVLGATVYRWVTWQASLQFAAFFATAFVASTVFREPLQMQRLLRATIWFATLISVAGVLAYFTSPGKILWSFPAIYPDNWGPFPSRNNFAQFLELCLPIALAQAGSSWAAMFPPALILAAGLASASRAGAALLLLETLLCAILLRRRIRAWLPFATATLALAALGGAATLWGRLSDPDPFQYRREISRSTLAMIAEHPWRGTGLGTFADVYPQFALFDTGARVEHAHDDWIEWAAEGGLPFAALWLVFAASLAPAAIRSGWGTGILAVFLHAGVDYPFARLGVAAWAFLLAGALIAQTGEKSARHPTKGLEKPK